MNPIGGVKVPEINVERRWSELSVRSMCIKYRLYTAGDCESYRRMLDNVEEMSPTPENMYMVAKDIYEHSDDQTITNVMFLLEKDAVDTFFEIGDME